MQNRKNEGGPFGDIEKICKKKVTKQKILQKNFLVMGGTRTRPSAWQTSKNPQKIRSRRSYINMAVV